jgi:hypothetical protein
LSDRVGLHQSALIAGYLNKHPFSENAEAERQLCLTIDVFGGTTFAAPGNAGYLTKEMAAACASIAERWPAIAPPAGANL